jgi:ARG and Rhodanese-Phosphatase-superfamily-associated Protein domain
MRLTTNILAAVTVGTMAAHGAPLRISGPYTHENLAIYLVHGPDRMHKSYLTLADAMEQRKVVVYETGSVNQLQVENRSGQDVYIQAGEIVKGGKQDRVLKDDLILPSSSGRVPVTVFCVEHGRWTQRGSEPMRAFAASPSAIASPQMKRAVIAAGSQRAVWAEVAAAQDQLARNLAAPVRSAASESSYQLTLEAPGVRTRAEELTRGLAGLPGKYGDAVGYVMAVNGRVTGADVYGTHELFRKLWPKQLEAAAVEAIAAPPAGGRITPPSMAEVRAAATGYGARVSSEWQANPRTSRLQAALPQGLVFETKDAAVLVHRSYVIK